MITIIGDEIYMDGEKVATVCDCSPSIRGAFREWVQDFGGNTKDNLIDELTTQASELSENLQEFREYKEEIEELVEELLDKVRSI